MSNSTKSLSALSLSNLTPNFTYSKPYLEGPPLTHFFLGQASWNNKQLWLLHTASKVLVFIVQASASSSQLSQIKAQVKELFRSKGVDGDTLQLSQVESGRKAQEGIRSHLAGLRNFLLLLSTESSSPLGLYLDFPVVRL